MDGAAWIGVGQLGTSVIQIILMIYFQRSLQRGQASGGHARKQHLLRYWPLGVMALILIGTWIPYLLWRQHDSTIRNPLRLVADDLTSCTGVVDGPALAAFREKYDVALACGWHDPVVDKYKEDRISVSALFTIRNEKFVVKAPFSPAMGDVLKQANERAIAELRSGTIPQGGQAQLRMSYWGNIILLPKNTDVAAIKTLSDVARVGGKLIELP